MLVRRGSGCAGLLGGSVYATKVCYHNLRASIDLDVVLDLEYQRLVPAGFLSMMTLPTEVPGSSLGKIGGLGNVRSKSLSLIIL